MQFWLFIIWYPELIGNWTVRFDCAVIQHNNAVHSSTGISQAYNLTYILLAFTILGTSQFLVPHLTSPVSAHSNWSSAKFNVLNSPNPHFPVANSFTTSKHRQFATVVLEHERTPISSSFTQLLVPALPQVFRNSQCARLLFHLKSKKHTHMQLNNSFCLPRNIERTPLWLTDPSCSAFEPYHLPPFLQSLNYPFWIWFTVRIGKQNLLLATSDVHPNIIWDLHATSICLCLFTPIRPLLCKKLSTSFWNKELL